MRQNCCDREEAKRAPSSRLHPVRKQELHHSFLREDNQTGSLSVLAPSPPVLLSTTGLRFGDLALLELCRFSSAGTQRARRGYGYATGEERKTVFIPGWVLIVDPPRMWFPPVGTKGSHRFDRWLWCGLSSICLIFTGSFCAFQVPARRLVQPYYHHEVFNPKKGRNCYLRCVSRVFPSSHSACTRDLVANPLRST
jgi:hypothetical protein